MVFLLIETLVNLQIEESKLSLGFFDREKGKRCPINYKNCYAGDPGTLYKSHKERRCNNGTR